MYATLMRFTGWLVMIPIVVLGWLAAIHMLFMSPLWKHADWVSAFGTLLAFAGTIWLAQGADRKARREAHNRAVIAAAGIFSRVEYSVATVRFCMEQLAAAPLEAFNLPAVPFFGLSNSLSAPAPWTDEEILPLAVLPDRVAARLVIIRSKVRHCADVMAQWMPQDGSVKVDHQSVRMSLLNDLRLVDESLKIVLSILGPLVGELHIVKQGPDGLELAHFAVE